jgi:hypothetical protein
VVYVDARLDRMLENPGEACCRRHLCGLPELEN